MEISSTDKASLHLADKKSVQQTQLTIDSRPTSARQICSCPKFIFGKLIMENSICIDVSKQSVPNAKFEISRCNVIPTANVTTEIVQDTNILVTASFKRPYFVQRKMLSAHFDTHQKKPEQSWQHTKLPR